MVTEAAAWLPVHCRPCGHRQWAAVAHCMAKSCFLHVCRHSTSTSGVLHYTSPAVSVQCFCCEHWHVHGVPVTCLHMTTAGCSSKNWLGCDPAGGCNSSDPQSFAPSALNVSNWADSMLALGVTEAVLTAKHGYVTSLPWVLTTRSRKQWHKSPRIRSALCPPPTLARTMHTLVTCARTNGHAMRFSAACGIGAIRSVYIVCQMRALCSHQCFARFHAML